VLPRRQYDRGAAEQRQIKLQRGDVEADGGDGEQPVVAP
jgi:hypothetical protein